MIPTGTLAVKDPDASAWPRGIDWTAYLAEIGNTETISTSSWVLTGPDAELEIDAASDTIVTGSKKTQLKLSGGTLGAIYTLTNSIVTSSGVNDNRYLDILIEDL